MDAECSNYRTLDGSSKRISRTKRPDWFILLYSELKDNRTAARTNYVQGKKTTIKIGSVLVFFLTEVGKNINQDKAVSLKRFVEDYHKYISSLNFPPANTKDRQREDRRARKRKGNLSHSLKATDCILVQK